jgi:hypothetical protein
MQSTKSTRSHGLAPVILPRFSGTPWLRVLLVLCIVKSTVGEDFGHVESSTGVVERVPINDNHTFDNTGGRFNVTKILTNGRLDDAKYQD